MACGCSRLHLTKSTTTVGKNAIERSANIIYLEGDVPEPEAIGCWRRPLEVGLVRKDLERRSTFTIARQP